MGVTSSLIVFAVGAIMRFAVTATSSDVNIREVGVILMIVGAIAFVVSLIFWGSWGGFGGMRRRRTVVRDDLPGSTVGGATRGSVYSEEREIV
jgi:hypothetical protein